MARIRVKNLLIRTYIGFNPDELVNKQDVIINLEIETDIPDAALEADEPDGIFDYKTITKKIIVHVQEGRFKLLEVLTKSILDLIMTDKWFDEYMFRVVIHKNYIDTETLKILEQLIIKNM